MDAAAGAMRASEIDARRANLAACHRICRTMRPRGSPASARRQPAQTQGPANPHPKLGECRVSPGRILARLTVMKALRAAEVAHRDASAARMPRASVFER